jgi:hypothetical protein
MTQEQIDRYKGLIAPHSAKAEQAQAELSEARTAVQKAYLEFQKHCDHNLPDGSSALKPSMSLLPASSGIDLSKICEMCQLRLRVKSVPLYLRPGIRR